jgi:hypothetical protein
MRGLLRRLKCDNYKTLVAASHHRPEWPRWYDANTFSATIIQIDLSIFMKFQRAVG